MTARRGKITSLTVKKHQMRYISLRNLNLFKRKCLYSSNEIIDKNISANHCDAKSFFQMRYISFEISGLKGLKMTLKQNNLSKIK